MLGIFNNLQYMKYIKKQKEVGVENMAKKKVVIVGAGPAGLTAAYYLLKTSGDYSVTIIEQDDKLGGISKTVEFDGYKVDTGIHRFFTKNKEVEKIWKDLLPIQGAPSYDDILLNRDKPYEEGGPNPEKDNKVMLIKDRVTRIYYGKKFYDYPVKLNLKTITNMGFLTLVKAFFSYLKACLFKKSETSLENFYINRFGKVLYSMFFESYTEKVWGVHPSMISADWGSQRVKGVSIKEVIKDMVRKVFKIKNKNNTETSLIERFVYPKLGAGQMYEEMAHQIKKMGGKIITSATVKKVYLKDKKVSKIIYEKDNIEKKVSLDYLLSSMPIKDLFMAFDGETIPKNIENIATNLPYREFMSVCLVVDKLKLKNTTKIKTVMDIIPDSWIYIQEKEVTMGRLQVFNNWSPYLFKQKTDIEEKVLLSLEYFCSFNDKYWNMTDQEFIKFAISEAEKIGLIDGKEVEASFRIKIKNAYPAYFGTYEQFSKVIKYLNTFENLYCIGRNGQHKYNNMDHSMLTGIEAAKNIIKHKKSKTNIWNVNAEKTYHEEK